MLSHPPQQKMDLPDGLAAAYTGLAVAMDDEQVECS
jgi:hypothetical protein